MSALFLLQVTIAVVTLAAINRFRGGGVIPERLFNPPGHRRFWATPAVFLSACLLVEPVKAGLFALCWLSWALLPWGRWYTCGRGARVWSGEPDAFERAIEWASARLTGYDRALHQVHGHRRILDDHICLALRNAVALPGLAVMSPAAAVGVLAGMAIAYEVAWRVFPEAQGPTASAEWWTGGVWGVALALVAIR